MVRQELVRVILRGSLICAALLLALSTSGAAPQSGRGDLWSVVSQCLAIKSTMGMSFPCAEVEPPKDGGVGYAILKSPRNRSEFLVTPAVSIAGLESEDAASAAAASLWETAWDVRDDVASRVGRSLPRTAVGLVVNSKSSRTQDQLHIHIDCVSAAVTKLLAGGPTEPGPWAQFGHRLKGTRYWLKPMAGSSLVDVNVLEAVMGLPQAAAALSNLSVAVIPASLASGDGFYVLASLSGAPSEPLLDHDCRPT
jgi:CDP-diacylglycerol pyrophosphatase